MTLEFSAKRMIRRCLVCTAIAAPACSGDVGGPPPPAGALQFNAVSAGYFQSCGLATDGRAYCWGMNDFGTLGDGTLVTRTRPAAVATTKRFTTLDTGAGHSCALTAQGEAFCWGRNDEGQVGDGTFQDRNTPVAVLTDLRFQSISAGHAHSCALTASGEAYCWGDDIRGQLGDGPGTGVTKSALPVRVQIATPLKSMIAGYYQSCALTTAGQAYCWGANESGQDGDGSTTNRDVPTLVQGNRAYTAIAPGDRFVCAISSGAVWCWGANRSGELGTAPGAAASAPVQLAGLSNVTAVFTASGASTVGSAEAYACALRTNSSAVCWGGSAGPLRSTDTAPRTLDDNLAAITLALGPRHVCLLSRAHYVYCGGANSSG
ncbi:MAG TPA: hypothetical protein VF021_06765, partial [Longimicrobiales bacterium]